MESLNGVLNTLIATWGELFQTLEDVVVLIGLPLLGEARTTKLPERTVEVVLDEEDKRRLEALNQALSGSKSSNKST